MENGAYFVGGFRLKVRLVILGQCWSRSRCRRDEVEKLRRVVNEVQAYRFVRGDVSLGSGIKAQLKYQYVCFKAIMYGIGEVVDSIIILMLVHGLVNRELLLFFLVLEPIDMLLKEIYHNFGRCVIFQYFFFFNKGVRLRCVTAGRGRRRRRREEEEKEQKMFKFLKGVVGGSGTGPKDLPYNIGEPYSSAWGSWTHCRGTSKILMLFQNGSAMIKHLLNFVCSVVLDACVFNAQDGHLAAGRNGVKRLRTEWGLTIIYEIQNMIQYSISTNLTPLFCCHVKPNFLMFSGIKTGLRL
ncbi:hypothetical protein FEM48_Zijuj02G0184300 [Ziziphus jujuba var. spinosa]|uniref:Uncharacterized protein n=1 Tax=Ziziphus jujuba var. spinosa TaxID=714518 RepID=A0A978VX95_ZIZJJ|nr:hypothetical protein FEM48_Zijuj02G0184300 [Ziziphus jujuba var. spinosa]